MGQQTPCPEYNCTQCGRSMIVLVGDAPVQPVCHRCRMLPGWHKRPEIVAACEQDEVELAAVPVDLAEDGRALH